MTTDLSRRVFIAELAAIGMGAGALSSCARAMHRDGAMSRANHIGLQLYTVRDLLEKDFEGTLAQVAQIGYKEVEFAGYFGHSPQQVRAILDRLDLVSPSAHVGVQLMRQDIGAQAAAAKTLGQEYITIPSYPLPPDAGADAFKQLAAQLNQWGNMCRAVGLRLAYHNHFREFMKVDGERTGFDVLLHESDTALVDFELDLYWAAFADQDPIALIAKYPFRFTMWHVKDMQIVDGKKTMTPVGRGTLDFKSIFQHAAQSGLKHFFVEHDNAATTVGSIASIQTSYSYLRDMLS